MGNSTPEMHGLASAFYTVLVYILQAFVLLTKDAPILEQQLLCQS